MSNFFTFQSPLPQPSPQVTFFNLSDPKSQLPRICPLLNVPFLEPNWTPCAPRLYLLLNDFGSPLPSHELATRGYQKLEKRTHKYIHTSNTHTPSWLSTVAVLGFFVWGGLMG